MGDLADILRGFTPTTYSVVWVGAMITIYMIREWRETRKLSAEDKLARRDGYAKQVQMLMAENRQLLDDQRQLRQEYDAHRRLCQQETDQLRKMIIDLENEIQGLKRNRAVDAIQKIRRGGGL